MWRLSCSIAGSDDGNVSAEAQRTRSRRRERRKPWRGSSPFPLPWLPLRFLWVLRASALSLLSFARRRRGSLVREEVLDPGVDVRIRAALVEPLARVRLRLLLVVQVVGVDQRQVEVLGLGVLRRRGRGGVSVGRGRRLAAAR